MMHGKKSKMKTSGGMPMVKKDGKMVPSFAADGVGKMKAGGAAGMMKPKMAAGGGMMKAKDGGQRRHDEAKDGCGRRHDEVQNGNVWWDWRRSHGAWFRCCSL
jgi:hypothetical protein